VGHGHESWDGWFAEYARTLVLLARQWTDSYTDAEDVVQEGFARFWRRRSRAKDPKAYLFACVRRASMDLARSQRRLRRKEEQAARSRSEAEPTLFCRVEAKERQEAIESAMARLPVEQREVLVMKTWGGLTFEQVGLALNISPNTAASRYRIALESLRNQLSERVIE